MSCVIVVSGAPAAGKSMLARELHRALGWPLLAKDELKETLFDTLGWSDRAWSKKLSGAAYGVMFAMARQWLGAYQSIILEGNFRWCEQQAKFSPLLTIERLRWLQVFVTAAPETLIARFDARIATRHPGHADAAAREDILLELRERPARPLPLPGELIELATDDSQADTRACVARVCAWALESAVRD